MDYLSQIEVIFSQYETYESPVNCNAQYVANKMGVRRNTASKNLNSLVTDGQLLKINTRPVLFIPKRIFEEKYCRKSKKSEFNSFTEMINQSPTHSYKTMNVFSDLIGYNASLKETIDQAIAALRYPGGLPIMLFGPSGTGKSFLAECLYDYCKQSDVINKEAPFIELNCAQYYNNPELLTGQLFGHKKGSFTGAYSSEKGIIENADGGIVFLDEIHRLPPEGQEKLFLHMDKGVFNRIGENGNWRKSDVRYIFATTESKSSEFLDTFLRRIPVTCSLLSYKERPRKERKSILFHHFQQESKIINRDILVSEQIFSLLLNINPKGNIGEVKNIIKQIVAKKMINTKENRPINIGLVDAPFSYLEEFKKNLIFRNNQRKKYLFSNGKYIHKESLYPQFETKKTLFFENIKVAYENYINNEENNFDIFREYINKHLVSFSEYFTNVDGRDRLLQLFFPDIQNIFQKMAPSIYFEMKGTTIQLIISYLLMSDSDITDSLKMQEKMYLALQEYLPKKIESVFTVLENIMDISLCDEDRLFISLCILSEQVTSRNKINGIILSHGYSTASSIASVVNSLIGEHIFDSIDMAITSSPKEVIEKLLTYIRTHPSKEGLLILVDMGSLSDMKKDIAPYIDVPTVIMNNVSTSLAINAGVKISQNHSLEMLYEELPEESSISRQIILPKSDIKPTILVTCAPVLETATKIKDLITQLIPVETKVEVVPYETQTLKSLGETNITFTTKNILLTIGTDDPELEGLAFVSLEELFQGSSESFYNILELEFGQEVAENIDANIVKNLSLNRLIDSLTILDASKLIEQLEVVLEKLQELLQIKLSNGQKINLYVHLSCMIERLVRKQPIKTYPDIQSFIEQNPIYIHNIKMALSYIEKLYNIEIPIEEVGYIFNLITMN